MNGIVFVSEKVSAKRRMARSGYWKSLDEIEKWLMDRDVPFTKQKWVDVK